MKPKDCTCTGVCLQIPDGSCQRLNKSMYSGSDKVPQFISSEPKADPKEKELYSIKDLEWMGEPWNKVARPFDFSVKYLGPHYRVYEDISTQWFWSWSPDGYSYPVHSEEEAKRQAQDHFNSKLKLCLNREL